MKNRHGIVRVRRVARGVLALGVAAALPGSALLAAPATANAPGNPGVPSAPTVLFSEGFGTGLTAGGLARLDTYDGAKYTADPAWLNEAAGNGLILDGTTSDSSLLAGGFTGANNGGVNASTQGGELRLLAQALGQLNGTNPATSNFAVTAYSNTDPGANKVEFEIKNPLALNAGGRFLTLAVNVSVVNCARASDPLLRFYLVDGATESQVNSDILNPCVGASSDAPRAVTLRGGNAVLFAGDQVGVRLRNENGSGSGNDHAYDDLRVLDVTPQLDKSFQDAQTRLPGQPVNLVFTVTNTSELGEKKGWEFTDALASGLSVAGAATTDCASGTTINAPVGATSIAVTAGALAEGAATCTITVPVTASKGGTFANGPENITSKGLDKPATARTVFATPATPTPTPTPTPTVEAEDAVLPATGAPAADDTDAVISAGGAVLAAGGLLLLGLALRRRRVQG